MPDSVKRKRSSFSRFPKRPKLLKTTCNIESRPDTDDDWSMEQKISSLKKSRAKSVLNRSGVFSRLRSSSQKSTKSKRVKSTLYRQESGQVGSGSGIKQNSSQLNCSSQNQSKINKSSSRSSDSCLYFRILVLLSLAVAFICTATAMAQYFKHIQMDWDELGVLIVYVWMFIDILVTAIAVHRRKLAYMIYYVLVMPMLILLLNWRIYPTIMYQFQPQYSVIVIVISLVLTLIYGCYLFYCNKFE